MLKLAKVPKIETLLGPHTCRYIQLVEGANKYEYIIAGHQEAFRDVTELHPKCLLGIQQDGHGGKSVSKICWAMKIANARRRAGMKRHNGF